MSSPDAPLDAHSKPPEALRHIFKSYQRAACHDLDNDIALVDFDGADEQAGGKISPRPYDLPIGSLYEAHSEFLGCAAASEMRQPVCYEHKDLKGKCFMDDSWKILVVPALRSQTFL